MTNFGYNVLGFGSYTSRDFYPFQQTNSLRFGGSAFLDRDSYTHSRRTFTYSFWLKPAESGTRQFVLGRYTDGSNVAAVELDTGDSGGLGGRLAFYNYSSGSYDVQLRTTRCLRDENAWYHIVLRVDSTSGTAGDRARIYINGVQETVFDTEDTGDQNVDWLLGDGNNDFRWGTEGSNNRLHFQGYLADITVIDGSSLAPSSFGEFKHGIWVPKNTSGLTYGDRGYRLEMKNDVFDNGGSSIGVNTGNNDVDLGSPVFTASGLAVGDSVLDSPTNNFAVLNGLSSIGTTAFSEGNLRVQVGSSSSVDQAFSSFAIPTTGKWYCEVGMTTIASAYSAIGLSALADGRSTGQLPRHGYLQDGQKIAYSTKSSYGDSFANGDVLGIAIDRDNRKLYFAKNGTWQNSGDPEAGSNEAFSSITQEYDLQVVVYNATTSGTAGASTFIFNAGQDSSFAGTETAQGNTDGNGIGDFYYAPPSGFLALCTSNLPDPVATIDPAKGGSPDNYFSANIFTGNGTNQDIDTGFDPDLVWTKQRTDDSGGAWMDRIRGDDAYFQTVNNNGEGNFANITFITDGYNVSGNSNLDNEASHNYAGWAWKAGTTFSNDASATSVGNVDSSGTVNTDIGFSIINFVVTDDATMTIAHGLNAVPEMIISKNRDTTSNWDVFHSSIGNTHRLKINSTDAKEDQDGVWADTDPTSTVFSQKGNGTWHAVGGKVINYCFASVDGYSRIGEYIGNGNANGPFVYTGFRPAFVMAKRTESTSSWQIWDNARDISNLTTHRLRADLVTAEDTGSVDIDMLSNGFKLRNTGINQDTGKYMFLAFAEQPFKYANGR